MTFLQNAVVGGGKTRRADGQNSLASAPCTSRFPQLPEDGVTGTCALSYLHKNTVALMADVHLQAPGGTQVGQRQERL